MIKILVKYPLLPTLLYYHFQHPWMVSIQNPDGSLHCGGAMVASNRIVTAAHCFIDPVEKKKMEKDKIQSFKVVAGTANPFDYQGE